MLSKKPAQSRHQAEQVNNFRANSHRCSSVSMANTTDTCCLLHGGFLLGLVFNPKGGGIMFLQNINLLSTDYMML
jgi:hypothetical protein